MDNVKIIDKGGKWISNPHQYAFSDPEKGEVYHPGVAYKVDYDEKSWIAGQIDAGVLAKADDPFAEEEPVKKDPPKDPPKDPKDPKK